MKPLNRQFIAKFKKCYRKHSSFKVPEIPPKPKICQDQRRTLWFIRHTI